MVAWCKHFIYEWKWKRLFVKSFSECENANETFLFYILSEGYSQLRILTKDELNSNNKIIRIIDVSLLEGRTVNGVELEEDVRIF